MADLVIYLYDGTRKPAAVHQLEIKDGAARAKLHGKGKKEFKEYINTVRGVACADTVSEDYIDRQIDINNVYAIIGHRVKKTYGAREYDDISPFGFLMGKKEVAGTDFYIDVICSAEYGNILLNYVLNYAEELGCISMTLNALPPVLAYYSHPMFNFKYGKTCNSIVEIPELAPFTAYVKSLGKRKPKTSAKAYEDENYVEFMRILHGHDLNKKTNGVCNNKGAITREQIIAGDCGEDGYTMVRCAPFRGGRRSTRRRANRRTTRRKN